MAFNYQFYRRFGKIAKTDKIDEELKNDVNTSNEAINQNPKENGQ